MLTSLLAFIVAIGLLVSIHEYGHYYVAKRCGVKVLVFSIGFGKPLWQWRRGETLWQIGAIPLGGYVSMLDEREGEPIAAADLPRAFNRRPPLAKMAIVAAGPLANFLLAILLYWGLSLSGVEALRPVVSFISAGSAAEKAGLRQGDEVLSVSGMPVSSWDELQFGLLEQSGGSVTVPLQLRSNTGSERSVMLDLSHLTRDEIDQQLLSRLGMSPVPLSLRVAQLAPQSAAAKAGIKAGDQLVMINGAPLHGWRDVQAAVASSAAQPLLISWKHNGQVIERTVIPDTVVENGQKTGKLGLAPEVDATAWQKQRFTRDFGPVEGLQYALNKTWQGSRLTLVMFWKMLTGQVSVKQVSGPITIATFAGESARMGLNAFLEYLCVISISLGVLNLLPLPVLDGGHLMYHTVEFLTGRRLPLEAEAFGQRIGIVLLLGLMSLALYNDIHRLFLG
ncbi:RIP metalloprotease RseP [Iodobacter sp. LRB]|uniref:RIP metalloprotease RseP n=1 Tax=unclassified Iodobacter TaxID=235634 RepID=UPI000C0E290A|nr:RIP metalloprotease RseP [Iodobacter sp. BJB302]PHV03668.1 RIP metalloprotease RseP [Iodobacter sp. BJB302]